MKIRCISSGSYQEQPITGHLALWQPQQVCDIEASDAAKLAATGLFTYEDSSTYANQLIDHAAEHAAMGVAGISGREMPFLPQPNVNRVGQPYGILRGLSSPGRLFAGFDVTQISWAAGSATRADAPSGFDADGSLNGALLSRTGQPTMLKVTTATSYDAFRFTTFATSAPNGACSGLLGLWVYLPAAMSGVLKMIVTTVAGGASTANGLDIGFTSNNYRPGWNFLEFRMRNYNAYLAGLNETEYHPYGVSGTRYGTGADANIIANPITRIEFAMESVPAGTEIYFDSLWTDYERMPQVILGSDEITTEKTYELAAMEDRGFIGYIATPMRVNGSHARLYDYEAAMLGADTPWLELMYSLGWDVVNHTTNHIDINTLTDPRQIAYELLGAQAGYAAKGFTRGLEFMVSPRSISTTLSERVYAEMGIKMQRHYRHQNCGVTPYGVDNLAHVGSIDVSAASGSLGAYSKVTNGVTSYVGGQQIYSKIKIATDMMLDYQSTWFPFWHHTTATGDSGSGEDLTGSDLAITRSAFIKWLDYLKSKEDTRALRVCKGMTGFYYGTN